jgi:hypothetical protein
MEGVVQKLSVATERPIICHAQFHFMPSWVTRPSVLYFAAEIPLEPPLLMMVPHRHVDEDNNNEPPLLRFVLYTKFSINLLLKRRATIGRLECQTSTHIPTKI